MLEKLSKAKMIDWAPRKGIRLTDKGRDRAKQIVSYHIIMELFLKRILHMKNEKEINRLACDFEHHFTPDLKKRMANLLGIENGIQNIDNVISENRFPKYIETDQLYSSTQVKQKVQSLENQLIRTISNAQDIKKLNKLIKKEFNQFYQDLEKS
jgi:Mn-dependent DtxR family transcriptional regulator